VIEPLRPQAFQCWPGRRPVGFQPCFARLQLTDPLESIVSSLHAARTCRENIGGATGIRRGHQSSRIASTEVAPKGRSDESDSGDG
jgi:hypothetical protein